MLFKEEVEKNSSGKVEVQIYDSAQLYKDKEVPQAVGGASGWVGGLGAFGGFVIPPSMGILVSMLRETGYARGFIIFIFLIIISIVFSVVLKSSDKVIEKVAI